jgi:hypothetical protein
MLREPVDPVQCKREWVRAVAEANALFNRLPPEEVGCLYLKASNQAVTPDPTLPEFSQLRRHYGSVRGAWLAITENLSFLNGLERGCGLGRKVLYLKCRFK